MIQEYISNPAVFKDSYISSYQYVHKVNIPEVKMWSHAYLALRQLISENSYFSAADMVRVFNINSNPYIIRIPSFNHSLEDAEKYIDILLLNTILHFEHELLLDDMEKIDNLKKDYLYNKDSALKYLGFSLLRQILSKISIELVYCK